MAFIFDALRVVYVLILHPKLVSQAWDGFIFLEDEVKLFNGVKNVHYYSKLKRIKKQV